MNKRPNKDTCIELIFDYIRNGMSYSDTLNEVRRKWTFPESTFKRYWGVAKERYNNDRKKINKEKFRISNEREKKALEKGLKTRFDRLFELQNDAERLQQILEKGITKDTLVSHGSPKTYERPLTEIEKEKLLARKQSILKQIQDMEADALPVKSHNTVELKSEFSASDALKLIQDAGQ